MNDTIPCGILIKQIHNILEKNANNTLRHQGMTLAQVNALMLLAERPEGQMSLKELERELRIAQSTTVGIVSRLEQRGCVVTFGDASDRRMKLVRITPQGRQYCADADHQMKLAEEQLLSGLAEDEKPLFCQMLRKVWQSLE